MMLAFPHQVSCIAQRYITSKNATFATNLSACPSLHLWPTTGDEYWRLFPSPSQPSFFSLSHWSYLTPQISFLSAKLRLFYLFLSPLNYFAVAGLRSFSPKLSPFSSMYKKSHTRHTPHATRHKEISIHAPHLAVASRAILERKGAKIVLARLSAHIFL